MKILFVVPYVPSLIRVRPYNLIRHLAARGHQVTLATVWTSDRERRDASALEALGIEVRSVGLPAWRSLLNCVMALPTADPLQARYSWSASLLQQIERLASQVDVVHVEHLRGARYGVALKSAVGVSAVPVVWDSVDCISDLFEQASRARRGTVGRWINRFELQRTRRYEGWAVRQFDRVLASSARDQASLGKLSSADATRVAVLSNGVDLNYFTPADECRQSDTLVFSGKMSYHANERAVVHLVREIMPLVWVRRPATRLVVTGKDPSKEILGLAERFSNLTVTGTVPDVRPYLRAAAIAVAPLVYGVGCQNKVLEAMASATPVIATSRAVAALDVQAGRDVVVADGAPAFADAVLALLDAPGRQLLIGRAGREYVETHHRWDRIAEQLEAFYAELLVVGHATSRHAQPALQLAH